MTYDEVPPFPLAHYVFPIEQFEHWIALQRDRVWSVTEAERECGVYVRQNMLPRMLNRGDVEHVDGPPSRRDYAPVDGRYRGTAKILSAVKQAVRSAEKYLDHRKRHAELFITEFRPKPAVDFRCPVLDADRSVSLTELTWGGLCLSEDLPPVEFAIDVCSQMECDRPEPCAWLALDLPGETGDLDAPLHHAFVDAGCIVLGQPLTGAWGYSVCGGRRALEPAYHSMREALLALFEVQAEFAKRVGGR